MAPRLLLTNKRGFALIELLIVMGMLGVIMAAIYSLYSAHQKTAYTEDEVVEVQQNLRIAVDSITRDVRMAGFLIPRAGTVGYTTPINPDTTLGSTSNAGGVAQPLPAPDNVNSDAITVNTISPFGTYARIDLPFTYDDATKDFPVDSPESVDMFNTGDSVRIVRGQDRTEPLDTVFSVTVIAANRTAKTITLTGPGTSTVYQRGDIITKVSATATINPPSTITYCLGPSAQCGQTVSCPTGQLCLMRIENWTTTNSMGTSANPVAANMAGLQFRYLMDDNSESDLPTSANFSKIRAVRVLLIAQTAVTTALSGGQPKVRRVEAVIQLRNR